MPVRILTLIPARGGSKAIPRKNIVDLGGRPLIAWTIEAARAAGLNDVIVSTDSPQIAALARDLGVQTPFMRPAELSTDSTPAIQVAQHALRAVPGTYDSLLYLQPTTPLRAAGDIIRACDLLRSRSDLDSVISVVSVGGTHPARMKHLRDGLLIDPPFAEQTENQNRQTLEPMVIRNGAIYLSRCAVIEAGSFKGRRCGALLMPRERSINIDDSHDLDYARWIVSKH
jgi:N-acylneuraminate cytidylyltransferase